MSFEKWDVDATVLQFKCKKNLKKRVNDFRNENSFVFTRNVPSRKEDFFLEPDVVNYLRSLDPRVVAQTLTKGR